MASASAHVSCTRCAATAGGQIYMDMALVIWLQLNDARKHVSKYSRSHSASRWTHIGRNEMRHLCGSLYAGLYMCTYSRSVDKSLTFYIRISSLALRVHTIAHLRQMQILKIDPKPDIQDFLYMYVQGS